MMYRVICVSAFWIVLSRAVPADYVFETWSKQSPDLGSCKLESRAGLTADEITKTNTETTDTEETTEEDDLNNFWVVDDLPKQSAFVSIKKLPDVYLDDHDLPSPINDMMTVERSEITEEAKDLQSPEFGERPLYDASMQPLDNIGKRNYQQQYTNYYYPQHPEDFQMYDDSYYYYDNNTMYPQEREVQPCTGNLTEKSMNVGNPLEYKSSEVPPTELRTPSSTSKPCEVKPTTVDIPKEITTTHTTTTKIPTKNSTCSNNDASIPKPKGEMVKKSDKEEKKAENIMKISSHKCDKKKEKN